MKSTLYRNAMEVVGNRNRVDTVTDYEKSVEEQSKLSFIGREQFETDIVTFASNLEPGKSFCKIENYLELFFQDNEEVLGKLKEEEPETFAIDNSFLASNAKRYDDIIETREERT